MNKMLMQLSRRLLLLFLLLVGMWLLPDFSSSKNHRVLLQKVNQPDISQSDISTEFDTIVPRSKDIAQVSIVEKLNATIEEQAFLFSTVQNQASADQLLSKIESNLLEVEKFAQEKGVSKLIDYPVINELKDKIALFRQNT